MTTLIPKIDLKNGGATPTGAVNRPINEKIEEFISVKDFGAKGDSVTDDTVAIQAAINYCANINNRKQTLYFPASNPACAYKITAPLVITQPFNIIGDGQFSTIIFAEGLNSSQAILDFDCSTVDQVYFCGISNIRLISNNSQPTGVKLKNVSYMLMKQVALSTLGKGMVFTGTQCFSNSFEEVTCYGITSYGASWDTYTGGGQWLFSGCTFTGTEGVLVTNNSSINSVTFYNCNFEGCSDTDMFIGGTVQGLTISGCRSEALSGGTSFCITPALGNSVVGLTITGCFWQSNFGNANPVNLDGNVQGYNISGNYAGYIGFQQFVYLGSNTKAGVISGNLCVNSPKVVNQANQTLTLLNNNNTAGVLPDYFSMTLTDASGAGLTFSNAEGTYTKIGNTVFWKAWVVFPTTSSSAAVDIAGLPYAVAPLGTWVRAGANVDITDYSAGPIYVAQGYPSTTHFSLWYNASNLLTNAELSGKTLYLSGSYTA
jgi:hypothetical protein